MLHLTLDDGFELDVDQNVFTDIRLFEKIRELQKGNVVAIVDVADYVMGDEKEKLYSHLADENGHTSIKDVETAVAEIIRKGSPKNSKSS